MQRFDPILIFIRQWQYGTNLQQVDATKSLAYTNIVYSLQTERLDVWDWNKKNQKFCQAAVLVVLVHQLIGCASL